MKRVLVVITFFLHSSVASSQTGGFVVPGDNLVVDGVPKIPAALADKVSRYTEFRTATVADWHPSKREMLIHTRFGDTSQIHHVRFPGGARTQLTFFPESALGGSYDADGKFFVFGKGTGGNERFQNYRYDLDTGNVTLLTDGKSRNSAGVWSRSRKWIAYTSTRRNGADVDLFVVDPADPKSDRSLAEFKGGGWSPLDWSPDDNKILVMEYVSADESYLWLVDAKSGEKSAIFPRSQKETVAYTGGQFSLDGKGIYTSTDKDSEFHRLVYLDLATKTTKVLTEHIPWDIDAFRLSPDGKRLAVNANQTGVGTLHLLDPKTGKELSQMKGPPGSIRGFRWHNNSRDLAFMLTSARSPTDIYSLDVETNKIERWTHSETGGLNAAKFSESQLIRWKSFDDREITGFLYLPSKNVYAKAPVIIDIHGGPEVQARPGFLGRKNYFPNEMGVAILFPNIRGSSGFGKTFLALDNGFQREDAYKDIGALFDWVAKSPDLDADRIMVTGGSYGGHMTLAVATYFPDRFRCALDIIGMSNLRTFLENTESYRRDLRRAEYGDERDPKMRAFMEKIAPLNNAHKIQKPLFIVQGKNDPRVPWTEAEQMVGTLKKQKTPVWYLMANDEGHGFAKKKNADFQFYATVMFMERYLLDNIKSAISPGSQNRAAPLTPSPSPPASESSSFIAYSPAGGEGGKTKSAEDWPGWLGPRRDGSTSQKIDVWKAPLKILWKQPVGEGHSSPVVADGKVYLFARPKGKDEEALAAFDAADGKPLWTKSYDRGKFSNFFGDGPRATPTVANGKAYTFGVTGILTCFDSKSGDQVWQVNTLKEFKAPNLFFGTSCSPLVDGERVFLNVGGPGASVVAFNAKDGSTIWKKLDDKASYSSPIAVGKGDERAVVCLTGAGLTALNVRDGKQLWQVPLVDKLSESSTTPVRSGDMIFATSITFGGIGVKLDNSGAAPHAKQVWMKPDLNCYFSTPVAVGKDQLYLVTAVPAIQSVAVLRCVDLATGKEHWQRPNVGKYHASLTRTGDDKLLLLEENGDLVLMQPDVKQYRELCRSKICGTTWAHPAIAGGRLYIRDANELICVQLP
ncbi:MAG: prolyl oligopeptidase family serine peptidase [Planctomycetes bacterium]|nr:prolyl oligopeptidase family serine peptidase [Planctomycetota bacterium]